MLAISGQNVRLTVAVGVAAILISLGFAASFVRRRD